MDEVSSLRGKAQNGASRSQKFSVFKLFLILLSFLVLLNLAYIDILVFLEPRSDIVEKLSSLKPSVSPIAEKPLQEENNICPQSCIDQIREATSSLKLTSTPSISTIGTRVSSIVKEFFIPFGSGSSSAGDWEDIDGLQAYIDSTNYEGIKKVTFEASVRIPTGNQTAYVRLFNKTDKHPIWFSEVSITGGTPALIISDPITLDEGNKLYQVQMKTQLKFLTVLDQARIHIITN